MDIDGSIRGDIQRFVAALNEVLQLPWGAVTLSRDRIEVITTPGKIVKPRNFDVRVSLKGQVSRRIQVEMPPMKPTPPLSTTSCPHPICSTGATHPDQLLGIAIRLQIAQKIHASTNPQELPNQRNDRARGRGPAATT